jgi:hypothetical protein
MAIADVDEIVADVHVTFHRGGKISTAVKRSPPRWKDFYRGENSKRFHKHNK